MTGANPAIVLATSPSGRLATEHFEQIDLPMPSSPAAGEVMCRTILLSISPGSRAWIQKPTYRDQVRAGEPMSGYTIAEVVEQHGTDLTPGTIEGAKVRGRPGPPIPPPRCSGSR